MAGSADKVRYILILADSRGRDLIDLLNDNNHNLQFEVKCYPGATIRTLRGHLVYLTDGRKNPSKYTMVVLFGGICSVTEIQYMPYRAAVVRYDGSDEILKEFTSECHELLEIADRLPLPVVFSSIVGIDLIKYAGHYNEKLFDMQRTIDCVIPRINLLIKEVNELRGLITPNISSCVHRCKGKGKGYRTYYGKLLDGCHPSEEVRVTWARALINCCLLNLEKM